MPSGPDNTVAIAAIVASSIITPSIVALLALRAQRRQDAKAEREHQITLLENALNDVTRQRLMMSVGFSMWRHGADQSHQPLLDTECAVGEAIEAVWLSENQVRIRFGEQAPVCVGYAKLVAAVGRMKEVYDRHDLDRSRQASPQDLADWQSAMREYVREQKAFVRTVREQVLMRRRRALAWRWRRDSSPSPSVAADGEGAG